MTLLLGVCKKIDLFTSFKGASPVECPAGKTGVVTAYYYTDGTGTGIAVGVTVTAGDCEGVAADPAKARLLVLPRYLIDCVEPENRRNVRIQSNQKPYFQKV